VRRGPKGAGYGGGGGQSSPRGQGEGGRMARWREDGAMVVVRSAGTDMRPGKERRGVTERSGARWQGRTRGERKGGATAMGCPLIGDTAGSGG
jgi:hypothetical protein